MPNRNSSKIDNLLEWAWNLKIMSLFCQGYKKWHFLGAIVFQMAKYKGFKMFSQRFVIVKFREDKIYALLYHWIRDFPNVINGGLILVSSECTIISMLLCLKMNYK